MMKIGLNDGVLRLLAGVLVLDDLRADLVHHLLAMRSATWAQMSTTLL